MSAPDSLTEKQLLGEWERRWLDPDWDAACGYARKPAGGNTQGQKCPEASPSEEEAG